MSILFLREPLTLNVALACEIGVNEAIVLQQVEYWLQGNKKRKQNFKNGHYWTYNTYEKWQEENFPFWSVSTVKRTFRNLEKLGLLLSSDKFNSTTFYKRKWYTIDYAAVDKLGKSAAEPQSDASGQNEPMVGSSWSEEEVKVVPSSGQVGPFITETSSESSSETSTENDDDDMGSALGEKFEINKIAFTEFVNDILLEYPDLFDDEMFARIYQQMVLQKCDLFTVDEAVSQVKRMKNYGLEKIIDFAPYFVGGILRNRLSKKSALEKRNYKKAVEKLRKEEAARKAAAPAAPSLPFYNYWES